ncbi:putative uncharacterized zinc finger protein 814 [Trichogramma pretiosum]|uniref:putative uncharacterized zinc finger protein 814 n=1 Tax=Trichogramma pretiosum TaxID=7493 RepID=UPI000C71B0C8|nr:putative uncharacterized zinc finger protein 814 [Trichogramma pretiosum]
MEFRAKEEPSDESIAENHYGMIDDKPDLKNFPLLPFPRENSTRTPRKCKIRESDHEDETEMVVEYEDVKPNIDSLAVQKIDDYSPNHLWNIKVREAKEKILSDTPEQVNFDSELNDDVEIFFECEDVKPNMNFPEVEKINDYFPNHLQKSEYSDDYKNENIINAEPAAEVKQECFGSDEKNSGEPIKRKSVIKKLGYNNELKNHTDEVLNNIIYPCNACDKTFKHRTSRTIHINTVHKGIKHKCGRCEKSYTQRGHLKSHVDAVHNGVTFACDTCGKSFRHKRSFRKHIDSIHNGRKYKCGLCGKKFLTMGECKAHIDVVHSIVFIYACEICGKPFTTKNNVIKHKNTMHRSPVPT